MHVFDNTNLGHGFRKYFTVEPALTDAQRDAVFEVRHQVYCEDLKFESERPDCRETDEHDRNSLHCLLRTATQPPSAVGCTRLILTRPHEPDYLLPFEQTCESTLDRSIIDPARLPRDRIAEVSRLAVVAAFRRRKGEARQQLGIDVGDYGTQNQPRFPYVPVSLYLGAVALASRSGIETLFVLTEPRLATHFGHLGVGIRQIGQPVSHRGQRVPSMMDVPTIIRDMRQLLRPLWRVVCEEIERGFEGNTLAPARAAEPAPMTTRSAPA